METKTVTRISILFTLYPLFFSFIGGFTAGMSWVMFDFTSLPLQIYKVFYEYRLVFLALYVLTGGIIVTSLWWWWIKLSGDYIASTFEWGEEAIRHPGRNLVKQ